MTTEKQAIKIIDHFGQENQIIKCIEELSELSKNLCKYLGSDKIDLSLITEEISDVENMLDQLKIIFNLDAELIENLRKFKLNRTIERIENE